MANENATPIVQRDFTSGISIDKYFPIKNSCADAKWVDLFSARRVVLSTHNTNSKVDIATWYITTIWDIMTGNDGKLYELMSSDYIYQISNTANYRNIRNFVDHTINGTEYRLLISSKFIHRYPTSWLMTYNQFNDWWWAWNSNWTVVQFPSTDTLEHTAWSTWNLLDWTVCVVWQKYNLKFTVNHTSWSFTITIWWDTPQTVSWDWTYSFAYEAQDTEWLRIAPTSDFVGSIIFGYADWQWIWVSTMEEWYAELPNLSYITPVLVNTGDLYIGNGNIVAGMDNDWILKTYLSLPKWTEIVEITRDDNYIIIWTRTTKDSVIYFWDWKSESPESHKIRKNDILQAVENQWDFCIAITGTTFQTKKVWKTNAYSRALAFTSNFASGSAWEESYDWEPTWLPIYFWTDNSSTSNLITSLWDYVFIPGRQEIIVYGRKNPSLPFAMVKSFPLYDCNEITAINVIDERLLVAYDDDLWDHVISFRLENINNVYTVNTNFQFGEMWYISLLPIVWLVSQVNESARVALWYKTPTTDTFLALFYKEDAESDRFTFIVNKVINPITTMPTIWSTYKLSWPDTTFTIDKITEYWHYVFVEAQMTTKWYIAIDDINLFKQTGTWSDLILQDKYPFRLFEVVTDTTENRKRNWTRTIPATYTELEFRVWLFTQDWNYSPEFSDLTLYYDIQPNG